MNLADFKHQREIQDILRATNPMHKILGHEKASDLLVPESRLVLVHPCSFVHDAAQGVVLSVDYTRHHQAMMSSALSQHPQQQAPGVPPPPAQHQSEDVASGDAAERLLLSRQSSATAVSIATLNEALEPHELHLERTMLTTQSQRHQRQLKSLLSQEVARSRQRLLLCRSGVSDPYGHQSALERLRESPGIEHNATTGDAGGGSPSTTPPPQRRNSHKRRRSTLGEQMELYTTNDGIATVDSAAAYSSEGSDDEPFSLSSIVAPKLTKRQSFFFTDLPDCDEEEDDSAALGGHRPPLLDTSLLSKSTASKGLDPPSMKLSTRLAQASPLVPASLRAQPKEKGEQKNSSTNRRRRPSKDADAPSGGGYNPFRPPNAGSEEETLHRQRSRRKSMTSPTEGDSFTCGGGGGERMMRRRNPTAMFGGGDVITQNSAALTTTNTEETTNRRPDGSFDSVDFTKWAGGSSSYGNLVEETTTADATGDDEPVVSDARRFCDDDPVVEPLGGKRTHRTKSPPAAGAQRHTAAASNEDDEHQRNLLERSRELYFKFPDFTASSVLARDGAPLHPNGRGSQKPPMMEQRSQSQQHNRRQDDGGGGELTMEQSIALSPLPAGHGKGTSALQLRKNRLAPVAISSHSKVRRGANNRHSNPQKPPLMQQQQQHTHEVDERQRHAALERLARSVHAIRLEPLPSGQKHQTIMQTSHKVSDQLSASAFESFGRRVKEQPAKYAKKFAALDLNGKLPFHASASAVLEHVEHLIVQQERESSRKDAHQKICLRLQEIESYCLGRFQHPSALQMVHQTHRLVVDDDVIPTREMFLNKLVEDCPPHMFLLDEMTTVAVHLSEIYGLTRDEAISILRQYAQAFVVDRRDGVARALGGGGGGGGRSWSDDDDFDDGEEYF